MDERRLVVRHKRPNAFFPRKPGELPLVARESLDSMAVNRGELIPRPDDELNRPIATNTFTKHTEDSLTREHLSSLPPNMFDDITKPIVRNPYTKLSDELEQEHQDLNLYTDFDKAIESFGQLAVEDKRTEEDVAWDLLDESGFLEENPKILTGPGLAGRLCPKQEMFPPRKSPAKQTTDNPLVSSSRSLVFAPSKAIKFRIACQNLQTGMTVSPAWATDSTNITSLRGLYFQLRSQAEQCGDRSLRLATPQGWRLRVTEAKNACWSRTESTSETEHQFCSETGEEWSETEVHFWPERVLWEDIRWDDDQMESKFKAFLSQCEELEKTKAEITLCL